MKITNIVLFSIFLLAFTANSLAEEKLAWNTNIGLFGGINFNMNSPSMSPQFATIKTNFNSNSTNIKGFGGIEANFPINNIFAITGRAAYNVASGTLKQSEGSYSNELIDYLHYVDINPMVKLYNILPVKPLYFTAGANIGIPIKKEYDFTQSYNNSVVNSQAADIPDAALRAALSVGLGYIISLENNLNIIPEISYHLPFTKVSSNAGWDKLNVAQLRAGISITYSIGGKNKSSSAKKKTGLLKVSMEEVNYYDKQGDKYPLKKITLEEVEYGELFPIIPYIFYDENKTEITENYQAPVGMNAAGSFVIPDLPSDAIEINKKTIDIVGKRMAEYPNANLNITGTIDMKKETDLSIAETRAANIKKYLINAHNIDANRIATSASKLPTKPSAQTVQDGIEENRRVEFSSNNPEILAPIFIKGEKQRIATPDIIEFVPNVVADTVDSWSLEIMQADRLVKQMTGEGSPVVRWTISPNELTASQIPVDYTYTIYSDDRTAKTNGTIPIDFLSSARKKTIEQPDKIINKYSLIIFDFDSPDISAEDKQVIDKYVIPNIKYKSEIDVYGFTDRIGNKEHNKKLSMKRATAIKNYIKTKNQNVKINVYGVGDSEAIFDNNSPIGRHLSRTVQIYLVTPKE